jgi:putative IMPACT (imprinted ancient) family translation regulator
VKDTYRTIAAPATGLFKDKGSKFLAFAFPVENESEIKQYIQQLKKEYFDARHHCYA